MLALINDTGILVVVLAVVMLFGASRLPKLARNLGEAGREFRKAHDEANPATTVIPAPEPLSALADSPASRGADNVVTLSRDQLDTLIAAKAAEAAHPSAS